MTGPTRVRGVVLALEAGLRPTIVAPEPVFDWLTQKGAADGPTEAEVAARVAAQEFGVKLRWVESESADTQANAERTMALLADQGVQVGGAGVGGLGSSSPGSFEELFSLLWTC